MKPMNLADVATQFYTDAKCRDLLRRLRWPHGVECPRCKEKAVELETEKELFYCKGCDYQFTVTAGTIFNDSHLPLTKWFMATLLLCEAKKGMWPARFSARLESVATRPHGTSATEYAPRCARLRSRCLTVLWR